MLEILAAIFLGFLIILFICVELWCICFILANLADVVRKLADNTEWMRKK